jgi:hypothetical protein
MKVQIVSQDFAAITEAVTVISKEVKVTYKSRGPKYTPSTGKSRTSGIQCARGRTRNKPFPPRKIHSPLIIRKEE